MHDAIIGERLHLPAVGIMTTAFISAGELMARVLGAKDYRFVVTPHPISSATEAQLAERANRAAQDAVGILLEA